MAASKIRALRQLLTRQEAAMKLQRQEAAAAAARLDFTL